MPYKIITKEEAIKEGLSHYFTGELCANGHLSRRRIKQKECMDCSMERARRSRKNNPWEDFSQDRKNRIYERSEQWRKTPHGRKSVLAKNKRYAERNKEKLRAQKSNRKKAVKKATPKWLSDTDKMKIAIIYSIRFDLSERTGIEYEVDHKIPIKGKNVCGLHVPWNLQIMPAKENTSKGNRLYQKYA